TPIATNDNWGDTQSTEVQNAGLAPSDQRESAIVRSLSPGAYTAVVRGKNNGTGIGLAEVYDVSGSAGSILAKLSTRGFVETNENVVIGGFIAGTPDLAAISVIVRGIGPSLKGAT